MIQKLFDNPVDTPDRAKILMDNLLQQNYPVIKHCVANIIANNNGEILLLRRSVNDKFHPLTWCLPSGGCDYMEDPKVACVRETLEECNTYLPTPNEDVIIVLPDVVIHYFRSYMDQKQLPFIRLDENEHGQYVWCTPAQWLKLDLILDLKNHLKTIMNINDVIEEMSLNKSEEGELEKGGVGSGRKRIFKSDKGEVHIKTKNARQHFVTHSTHPSYSKDDELNNVEELKSIGLKEVKKAQDTKLNDLSDYKEINKKLRKSEDEIEKSNIDDIDNLEKAFDDLLEKARTTGAKDKKKRKYKSYNVSSVAKEHGGGMSMTFQHDDKKLVTKKISTSDFNKHNSLKREEKHDFAEEIYNSDKPTYNKDTKQFEDKKEDENKKALGGKTTTGKHISYIEEGSHNSYKDFSSDEHKEAAEHLKKKYNEHMSNAMGEKSNSPEYDTQEQEGSRMQKLALTHIVASKQKSKK